jgi:hypothetical protein
VRSFAPAASHPALYGEGSAASRCIELLDATVQLNSLGD